MGGEGKGVLGWERGSCPHGFSLCRTARASQEHLSGRHWHHLSEDLLDWLARALLIVGEHFTPRGRLALSGGICDCPDCGGPAIGIQLVGPSLPLHHPRMIPAVHPQCRGREALVWAGGLRCLGGAMPAVCMGDPRSPSGRMGDRAAFYDCMWSLTCLGDTLLPS